jgi:hypothetical protein
VTAPLTICFDLDGVLCNQTEGNYEDAIPNRDAIAVVNSLYDRGHRIIIHTSRFMGRAKGDPALAQQIGLELTEKQLAGWGVKFHTLFMGKPRYDVVVDDRAVFFRDDWQKIGAELAEIIGRKTSQ